MRYLKISTLFIFCFCNAYAQIGAKVHQDNIVGNWINNDFGFQMTLLLNADGSGEFDGEMLKYAIEGNKIVVTQFGAVTEYTYTLQSGKLTLSGGDLETAVTFLKNLDASPASGNSVQSTTLTFAPEQPSSNSDDKLIGTWSSNGENIEFKTGGVCNYMGQSFPYKTSPGVLTLTTMEGNISFGYSVSGDKLTLTYNQNTVTYTKGSGVSVDGSAHTNQAGGVDQDLVGKWCYVDVSNIYGSSTSSSSSCITLNANGTYEYYSESSRSVNTPGYYGGTNSQGSDQGTWYVQGDRIYYNSQSKGPGSYRLEKRNHPKNVNDPMIILDGTAYVTAYQKAPWR